FYLLNLLSAGWESFLQCAVENIFPFLRLPRLYAFDLEGFIRICLIESFLPCNLHTSEFRLFWLFLLKSFHNFLPRSALAVDFFIFLLRWLDLFDHRLKSFHAQLNLLLFAIHFQHFCFNFVTFFYDFAGSFHITMCQFADMHHAWALGSNINKGAICFEAHNLAFYYHIWLDLFPFKSEWLDHRQFNAIFLDASYPYLNGLSFLHNILHFIN